MHTLLVQKDDSYFSSKFVVCYNGLHRCNGRDVITGMHDVCLSCVLCLL